MLVRATPLIALVLLLSTACGSEQEEVDTRVAVRNQGSASIDAKISDGTTELKFTGVAAGTSSAFQTVTFGSLSALKVQVGDVSSDIELSDRKLNVVAVGADGKVADVSVVVVSAGSEGGGW